MTLKTRKAPWWLRAIGSAGLIVGACALSLACMIGLNFLLKYW